MVLMGDMSERGVDGVKENGDHLLNICVDRGLF